MTIIQEVQKIKKKKKIEEKNRVLKSGKKLFGARDDIVDLFEKGTFPYKGSVFKIKEEELKENKLEKIKDDYNNFFKYIEGESKDNLFEDYFSFSVPSAFAKKNYIRQKIKRKIMT